MASSRFDYLVKQVRGARGANSTYLNSRTAVDAIGILAVAGVTPFDYPH
jgi:hypothetical protein